MNAIRRRLLSLFIAIIVVLSAGAASAQRYVVVNGIRLDEPQIQALEQLACGPIADGNYWLDTQSGIWGYAGNPYPMGHISANCGNQQQPRRPSLSERGMLFSPHDWTR